MRNRPSSDSSGRLSAALLIAVLCPFVASLIVVPESANVPAIETTLSAQSQTTIWDAIEDAGQRTEFDSRPAGADA